MNFTCIKCPLGCSLKIEKKGNEYVVTGNNCERGRLYAIDEMTAPKRIVTSLIKTKEYIYPCKTTIEVPKEMVFEVLDEIGKIKIKKAKIGDVVLKNVLNTGADIIITGNGNKF